MPTPEQDEITSAYKAGVRASVFMAREIESIFTELSILEGESPDILLPILEFSIFPAMESLGNLLNEIDAVDDESEHATDAAFVLVRRVLKKYGRLGYESDASE